MNSSTPQHAGETPSKHTHHHARARLLRSHSLRALRRFIDSEKRNSPLLFWAAVVGLLAGLIGSLFQLAVIGLIHARESLATSLEPWPVLWWLGPMVISASLAHLAFRLVRRFAPETGGSGVQEIEGALDGLRPMRWRRVLPVKFLAGVMALGAGMVLGREGPTIQMGASAAQMIGEKIRATSIQIHTLLASGAGAGLAAAFNAPLAGILFVIEEMRPQFKYNFLSVQSVIIAVVMAVVVLRLVMGQAVDVPMPSFTAPPIHALWLFLLLGVCFGVFGYLFNATLIRTLNSFQGRRGMAHPYGALLVGALVGLLTVAFPKSVGGGYEAIPWALVFSGGAWMLLVVFLARFIMTMACYGSGVPGGIFAPMMAMGVIFGLWFGHAVQWLPEIGALHGHIPPGVFAVAGMGALFAATVRAPLTGIALAIEMTDNYELILPLIVTCLAATIVAQGLGGKPIYSVLLHRTLRMEELRQWQQEREQQNDQKDNQPIHEPTKEQP